MKRWGSRCVLGLACVVASPFLVPMFVMLGLFWLIARSIDWALENWR